MLFNVMFNSYQFHSLKVCCFFVFIFLSRRGYPCRSCCSKGRFPDLPEGSGNLTVHEQAWMTRLDGKN